MELFFQTDYKQLVDSPNQSYLWWHNMPLPDGNRINGHNPDKDLQLKMWQAMEIPNDGGLTGKRVLDIGANDGFFTLAAIMAGAEEVTAIDKDWATWPQNIQYSSRIWNVSPEIITADFRTYEFRKPYDVILFLGVLYHLEDVFSCMKRLRGILKDRGTIYLETQMTGIQSDLPIFEYASDIFPTIAGQDKDSLKGVGISNYLFPNEPAMRNLAHSYDFDYEVLNGPSNRYSKEHPDRQFYKFTKQAQL
jgi:2-polyprenyl-3-methyl-5-hydroxy-6-metoxy-1,4-benzoquinol methylase